LTLSVTSVASCSKSGPVPRQDEEHARRPIKAFPVGRGSGQVLLVGIRTAELATRRLGPAQCGFDSPVKIRSGHINGPRSERPPSPCPLPSEWERVKKSGPVTLQHRKNDREFSFVGWEKAQAPWPTSSRVPPRAKMVGRRPPAADWSHPTKEIADCPPSA
jgi:hypothetical protein